MYKLRFTIDNRDTGDPEDPFTIDESRPIEADDDKEAIVKAKGVLLSTGEKIMPGAYLEKTVRVDIR